MKSFETLATALTPDRQQLSLHRRDEAFYILLDGEELMATRAPGSEIALGQLGCEKLPTEAPRVLIGGLGLGYTLRAALDHLPPSAAVLVAEVFPCIVEWHGSHLRQLQSGALDDRRTRIVQRDVWEVLEEEGPFDSVMLDVDNGPNALCLKSNNRLYDRAGLERVKGFLKPGGVLAVWSAGDDQAFTRRMRKTGFDTRAVRVRSRFTKGNRHVIFVGRLVPRGARTGPRGPARDSRPAGLRTRGPQAQGLRARGPRGGKPRTSSRPRVAVDD